MRVSWYSAVVLSWISSAVLVGAGCSAVPGESPTDGSAAGTPSGADPDTPGCLGDTNGCEDGGPPGSDTGAVSTDDTSADSANNTGSEGTSAEGGATTDGLQSDDAGRPNQAEGAGGGPIGGDTGVRGDSGEGMGGSGSGGSSGSGGASPGFGGAGGVGGASNALGGDEGSGGTASRGGSAGLNSVDDGGTDDGATTDDASSAVRNDTSDADGGTASPDADVPLVIDCGLPQVGSGGVAKPSGAGTTVRVLNWAGYTAAATYTFDDGTTSQIQNYGTLNSLGVHFTFFLIGNRLASTNSTWAQAILDGHEIGNHTQTHPAKNQGTQVEVDLGLQTLETTFGITVYTMAAPNGDLNYTGFAKKDHFLNRGVSDGLATPGDDSNAFYSYCYIPAKAAAVAAFNSEIDTALSAGKWRVILVHGFTGDSTAYNPVDLSVFTSAVTYAKGKTDLWIDTYKNVGAYWRGQVAFNQAQTSTSAGEKTWTWALPANFPPTSVCA